MNSLSEKQNLVLGLIPAGHKQAIRKAILARLSGLTERDVREIIYDLVVHRGIPIGSSTESDSGGYFIIQGEDDLEVATRHLIPRAQAIFRRARALEKIAQHRFSRQLSLLPEDE
ncbi:MAG: DNA replication protein [Peptococcaceae bacterium BRH_c8a]|nr:MAG: DNA replication protein [Peptococcaceae bacterium BRH_c8a]